MNDKFEYTFESQERLSHLINIPEAPIHGCTKENIANYGNNLARWVHENHPHVCILDITFFDFFRSKDPYVIIVGTEENLDLYISKVFYLVKSGDFLLGFHPIYKEGVPIVEGKIPDTEEAMKTVSLENNVDEAVLYGTINQQSSSELVNLSSSNYCSSKIIFPEDLYNSGLRASYDKCHSRSLTEMWGKFCEAFIESRDQILDLQGRSFQTIITMPIGNRTPTSFNTNEFISYANLFIITSKNKDEIKSFLQDMRLHIFKSNALVLGRVVGEQKQQSIYAHQTLRHLQGMKASLMNSKRWNILSDVEKGQLLLLISTTHIFDRRPADRTKNFYPEAVSNPIQTYLDIAAAAAEKRALESGDKQVHAAILRLGMESKTTFLEYIGISDLPIQPLEIFEREAFALMFIHSLTQSLYHSFRIKVIDSTQFWTPEIRIIPNKKAVHVQILNPGTSSKEVARDEFILKQLADVNCRVGVTHPVAVRCDPSKRKERIELFEIKDVELTSYAG